MIKIEQDGFYLNATGEIVHIEIRGDGIPEDDSGNRYDINGVFADCSNSDYDLIGYIPLYLHYNILKTIKSYHKNESYKSFIDREFKKEKHANNN